MQEKPVQLVVSGSIYAIPVDPSFSSFTPAKPLYKIRFNCEYGLQGFRYGPFGFNILLPPRYYPHPLLTQPEVMRKQGSAMLSFFMSYCMVVVTTELQTHLGKVLEKEGGQFLSCHL